MVIPLKLFIAEGQFELTHNTSQATSWQLGHLKPTFPHNHLVVEDEMKWVSFVFSPHHVQSIQPISSYSLFGLCLSPLAEAFSTVSPWLPEVSVIDCLAWLWQGHCCHATPIIELLVVGRAGSDRQQERVLSQLCPGVVIVHQQWMVTFHMTLKQKFVCSTFSFNECIYLRQEHHPFNIHHSTYSYETTVTC